ncbi:MAG TPA: biotin synthase BioB [Myxococcota bacterium]|nr:biotin synthase BioB [Myxococcota bacterium]
MTAMRHDWTREEIVALFELPFLALVDRARAVHLEHHDATRVQLATLSNIKAGGCPEDCGYCPQSARYQTAVKAAPLLDVDEVVAQARTAREHGASRFCMGAAWRQVRDGAAFDRVVDMVREVNGLGMEVCVTLGMLEPHQIERLAEAGLSAYNHNLDTSREHYERVISTRGYDDRLRTLEHVRAAGVSVCTGGIVGLGEGTSDRAGLLLQLASMRPHPESVPINKLVRAPGTPLADQPEVDTFDWLRTIAVARVVLPGSLIRLAAGRTTLSREAQALAFLCGANSLFYGEKLLTTPNPDTEEDRAFFAAMGLRPMEPRPVCA